MEERNSFPDLIKKDTNKHLIILKVTLYIVFSTQIKVSGQPVPSVQKAVANEKYPEQKNILRAGKKQEETGEKATQPFKCL